jgi:hypothetical protein
MAFPPEVTQVLFKQIDNLTLTELFAPMAIQLERTKAAFNRWTSKNLYLEAKLIREGNLAVRDLLINKAHLIPSDLMQDAHNLIQHYDRWLEEYDRVRGGTEPDKDAAFVFVGPQGYPFPSDSERRFMERYQTLMNAAKSPQWQPGVESI